MADVERLRAEAGGADQQRQQQQAAPAPIDGPSPKMIAAATMAIYGLGNAVCIRARVPKLSQEEAAGIGTGLAELAHVYGFVFDRKIEAWIALGGAIALVAVPRIEAYKPAPALKTEELTPETRAPAPPPPPAAQPAGGLTDQAASEARSFSGPS